MVIYFVHFGALWRGKVDNKNSVWENLGKFNQDDRGEHTGLKHIFQ